MKKNFAYGLVLIALLFELSASASSDSAAQSSTIGSDSLFERLKENTSIVYYGEFNGPSLNRLNSKLSNPNPQDPTHGKSIYLYNSVTVKYRTSEKVSVYLGPRFDFQGIEGRNFTLLDPRGGVSISDALHIGRYSMNWSTLRSVIPITEEARAANLRFQPQWLTLHTYDLGGRWYISLWSNIRASFYGRAPEYGDANSTDFDLEAMPGMNFQTAPDVVVRVAYNLSAGHYRQSPFMDLNTLDSYIRIQTEWIPLGDLTLAPYLNLYTGNSSGNDSTRLGMEISASLF